MLVINDLHVEVQNSLILKGVNLEIPDNEVHSLFGPNGSGKSVLISTLMGYPEYNIIKGEIIYNNQNICQLSIDERVKLGMGISEQRPPTVKGIKLKNLVDLILPSNEHNRKLKEQVVQKFNIENFLDREINDGLSGGEIKKSELFLLLLTKPKFLILDEPDSGVDPEQLKNIGTMINDTIQEKGRTEIKCPSVFRNSGLIATHSAAILNYIHTDKAHVMLDGKIKCSGNPCIMMEQIKTYGYAYCVKCQQNNKEN